MCILGGKEGDVGYQSRESRKRQNQGEPGCPEVASGDGLLEERKKEKG